MNTLKNTFYYWLPDDYPNPLDIWKQPCSPTTTLTTSLSYLTSPVYKVLHPIGGTKMIVKVNLAGVDKDNINITLDKDKVIIELEQDTDFVNAFKLDFDIYGYDKDSLKHSFENGVLVLEFEKKEEFKPKKIKL